ncbi:hypothetical protein Ccrd_025804, partial [Cynara cardunculus var. scolymus]
MVAVPHNSELDYPENHQVQVGFIHQYQYGSGIADLVPKVGSFENGSFSEMVNPFGNLNLECGVLHHLLVETKENALILNSTPLLMVKEKKEMMKKNRELMPIGGGKQMEKQAKENSIDSGGGGPTKDNNYIHVRAKRGQTTNSDSLAER